MNPIPPTAVFGHCGDVRYRIIDDEAVVIRQDAGEVLGLNDVGARLLDLIDAKTSVEGLFDKMADEFEIDRDRLEKDILGILQELRDVGVIEEV